MLIAKIWGGLGNQMFQYAAGRALSKRIGQPLRLDLAHFRDPGGRPYRLDIFKINATPLARFNRAWIARRTFKHSGVWNIANSVLPPVRHVRDRQSGFDSRFERLRGNVYLDGFWQSPKYFAGTESDLRREFSFQAPASGMNRKLLEEISERNSVCVHVRRGDYILNQKSAQLHGTCDADYYRRGLGRLREQVPDAVLYLFSDDHEWVRTYLRLDASTVSVSHNVGVQDHEDLRLMSACKHFIIANSSFSWWAAWLSAAPDKRVIAPRRWFRQTSEEFLNDLLPPEWERM